MGLDLSNLGTFIAGGMSVYMFFWNQARAKKSDDQAVDDKIQKENHRQDKDVETLGNHLHKRIGDLVDLLSDVQYKLGFNDGHREGYEKGKAEVRADVDMIKKITG